MKPGQCFTIEPMINEGTHRDEQWPDNWTAVTRDGKRSAQFEHTILVTETGFEVLTLGVGWDVVMDGLKPVEASSSS
jgi:methionyl aminopeptidase